MYIHVLRYTITLESLESTKEAYELFEVLWRLECLPSASYFDDTRARAET